MYSVSTPAGLLSTIPVQLGRYPSNSVVALMIDGKASGATLRVDRPDVMDSDWMDTFVSYLAKAPCDKVVLAVYCADTGEPVPYRAEVDLLADYITTNLPVQIMMAALITDAYWLEYSDPGLRRPTLELEVSPVLMEMVAHGVAEKNVHTIPDALPDVEFNSTVELHSYPLGEFETERLFALWNSLLASGTMPDVHEAVRIVAGFGTGMVRDGMLVRLFAEDVALDDYGAALLGTLAGFTRERHEKVVALMNHLLTLDAPARNRASLLAGLGWLHWHAGRGTLATDCFEAGLALDPEHRLCHLLHQLVMRGHLSPVAATKSYWTTN